MIEVCAFRIAREEVRVLCGHRFDASHDAAFPADAAEHGDHEPRARTGDQAHGDFCASCLFGGMYILAMISPFFTR